MNVYVLDIAPLRGREREALALLPEERREKALRIRREEARLRSIGASLLLRAAGIEPPFACGEHGKPYIPGGPHFSLTHSGTLAALAVSDTPVGLDIEKIAPVRRAAARALTIEERDYMEADPVCLSLDTQGGRAQMHRRGTLAADERLLRAGGYGVARGRSTLALHRGIRKLYAVGGCGVLGGIYAAARRCSGASVRRIRYGTERNRKSGRGSRAALAG